MRTCVDVARLRQLMFAVDAYICQLIADGQHPSAFHEFHRGIFNVSLAGMEHCEQRLDAYCPGWRERNLVEA